MTNFPISILDDLDHEGHYTLQGEDEEGKLRTWVHRTGTHFVLVYNQQLSLVYDKRDMVMGTEYRRSAEILSYTLSNNETRQFRSTRSQYHTG